MVLHLYWVEVPALVNPLQLLRRTEEWISLLAKRRHGPLDVREKSYCKEYEIDCDAEGKSERRVCWDVLFEYGSRKYGLRSNVGAIWPRPVEDERKRLVAV